MIIFEKNNPDKKVFKIRYDSIGNHFLIQIIGASQYIIYKETNIKPNKRSIPAFLFSNEVKKSNIAQNSFHICNNKFLSFVSQVFNNIYHDPNVSTVSASLFYSVAPKSLKLQRQEILRSLNPDLIPIQNC